MPVEDCHAYGISQDNPEVIYVVPVIGGGNVQEVGPVLIPNVFVMTGDKYAEVSEPQTYVGLVECRQETIITQTLDAIETLDTIEY